MNGHKFFRTVGQPLFTPEGDGGGTGGDAAAKAAADAAAATAAAAAGKTPEQLAADAAEASKAGTDAAAAAAAAKAAEEAAKAGAPAKYELALPKDGAVDAASVALVEELAREANLPNDTAQSILETTNAVLVKQAEKAHAELIADKTYGGEKLAETQKLATEVLDKFAPKGDPYGDGLRRMLRGADGSNLYVAAMLARIGRAMQEDGGVGGATAASGESKKKPIEQILYPNSPEFKQS